MNILTKVTTYTTKAKRLTNFYNNFSQNHSSIIKKSIEVPIFCDIHVNVPHNVRIKPLNVHKYHNYNQLIIQLDERYEHTIQHSIDGNKINITSDVENIDNDVWCSIKAPVKANLDIVSQKDIALGFFNGDKVNLSSTEGNISVDRFQGDSINVTTTIGDIILHNYIQASKISATVIGHGNIKTGRLQGLILNLKIQKGDLSVESSYCSESNFLVENGNMDLHNIHKHCEIMLKRGSLNLTGFDGKLKAVIEKGKADIHLSRITENSEIRLKEIGPLNLHITETCQDYTKFEIKAKSEEIAENIKSEVKRENGTVLLIPDIEEENCMFVNCPNSSLILKSTSWQDMIKLKLKK